jgi:hypothetical protein
VVSSRFARLERRRGPQTRNEPYASVRYRSPHLPIGVHVIGSRLNALTGYWGGPLGHDRLVGEQASSRVESFECGVGGIASSFGGQAETDSPTTWLICTSPHSNTGRSPLSARHSWRVNTELALGHPISVTVVTIGDRSPSGGRIGGIGGWALAGRHSGHY